MNSQHMRVLLPRMSKATFDAYEQDQARGLVPRANALIENLRMNKVYHFRYMKFAWTYAKAVEMLAFPVAALLGALLRSAL